MRRKGTGAARRKAAAVAPPANPSPLKTGQVKQPDYALQKKAGSRTAFGYTVEYLCKQLRGNPIHKKLMDYTPSARPGKILKKFLRGKFENTITKYDVAGYGQGSLFGLVFDFEHRQSDFDSAGQTKKQVGAIYDNYLTELDGLMKLNDDGQYVVACTFVLMFFVPLLLYANYVIFMSLNRMSNKPVPFRFSRRTLNQILTSLKENYEKASKVKGLNAAEQQKLARTIMYYMTIHQLNV